MMWLGNNVFSSNGDKVELYKKAIIDYLDVNLNSKKTEYELQELYDLEKSIYQKFNDYINSAYQVIDISGKPDASLQKDKELLNEFKASIQRRYEILNETYDHNAESRQSFFKRMDEAANEYEWYVSQTKTLDKRIIKLYNLNDEYYTAKQLCSIIQNNKEYIFEVWDEEDNEVTQKRYELFLQGAHKFLDNI